MNELNVRVKDSRWNPLMVIEMRYRSGTCNNTLFYNDTKCGQCSSLWFMLFSPSAFFFTTFRCFLFYIYIFASFNIFFSPFNQKHANTQTFHDTFICHHLSLLCAMSKRINRDQKINEITKFFNTLDKKDNLHNSTNIM